MRWAKATTVEEIHRPHVVPPLQVDHEPQPDGYKKDDQHVVVTSQTNVTQVCTFVYSRNTIVIKSCRLSFFGESIELEHGAVVKEKRTIEADDSDNTSTVNEEEAVDDNYTVYDTVSSARK